MLPMINVHPPKDNHSPEGNRNAVSGEVFPSPRGDPASEDRLLEPSACKKSSTSLGDLRNPHGAMFWETDMMAGLNLGDK